MTVIDGQSGGRVLTQPANFNKLTTWEGFVIQNGATKGDNADSNGAGVKLMSNGKLKIVLFKIIRIQIHIVHGEVIQNL